MSNRFLCNFNYDGDYSSSWPLSNRFLGQSSAWVKAYYFFYCAQPLSTSASIQNIRTNLREYYVKRLKINLCMYVPSPLPSTVHLTPTWSVIIIGLLI